ncbi:uncharacterized protein LOC113286059 isoform X2 [Papaver somniferum]|uniref:uncharacterized protein LOC113286059 isoform X2 n=1 Tax=Papaver somniferum TaxID=3469 RepID=UPI000E6FA7F5|nr:uncharacterized protein LOC113286059 isoform X2 [Papaver somniferum]
MTPEEEYEDFKKKFQNVNQPQKSKGILNMQNLMKPLEGGVKLTLNKGKKFQMLREEEQQAPLLVSEEINNQISVINSRGVVINHMEKPPKAQKGKSKSNFPKARKNRLEAIILRKNIQSLMGTQKQQKKKTIGKGKSKSKLNQQQQDDCLVPPHQYYGKPPVKFCQSVPISQPQQFTFNTQKISDNSVVSTFNGTSMNQKEIFVPPFHISAPLNVVPWPYRNPPPYHKPYPAPGISVVPPIGDTVNLAGGNGKGNEAAAQVHRAIQDTQNIGDGADSKGGNQESTATPGSNNSSVNRIILARRRHRRELHLTVQDGKARR